MRHVHRTSILWIGACALALVLSAGGPVFAGERLDPDSYREYDIGDGTVTLDVQDAPFGQVIADRIQPRTRVNIVVSPEALEQQVTLQVLNLYWVQTLEALVAGIDGVMIREGPNLIRIERPLPVSFEFTDEDVRSVITAIAGFASANVILSQEVQGTITLNRRRRRGAPPWSRSFAPRATRSCRRTTTSSASSRSTSSSSRRTTIASATCVPRCPTRAS